MAVHEDDSTLTVEIIDEYLQAAEICLKTIKADGGCLGSAATLLLFCVVNALGGYLRGDTVQIDGKAQKITNGEPFRVFNHLIFGQDLKHNQIKLLERSYRNALAHNAVLETGAILVRNQTNQVFTFALDKVQVINVELLHDLVANAWTNFDRKRLSTWSQQRNSAAKSRAQGN